MASTAKLSFDTDKLGNGGGPSKSMQANFSRSVSTGPSGIFLRESCYAPVSRSGARNHSRKAHKHAKATARWILGEAIRESAMYCLHVQHPKPARVLYGLGSTELVSWYEKLLAASQQRKESLLVNGQLRTRRQRCTTPILGASIAGFNGPPDPDDAAYKRWRLDVVAWAMHRYGEHLVAVIEHVDEPNGHLHIIWADEGRPVKPLMAGHGAAMSAIAIGAGGKAITAAYKTGCQELLDDYYQRVGRHCGQARLGPDPQPRLPYRAAKALRAAKDQAGSEAQVMYDATMARAAADARAVLDRVQATAEEATRRAREAQSAIASRMEDVVRYEQRLLATSLALEKSREYLDEEYSSKVQAVQELEQKLLLLLAEIVPGTSERARLLQRFGIRSGNQRI